LSSESYVQTVVIVDSGKLRSLKSEIMLILNYIKRDLKNIYNFLSDIPIKHIETLTYFSIIPNWFCPILIIKLLT